MRNNFLEDEDCNWLKETHLSGVPLPDKYKDFKLAILQGSEDCPAAVNLYAKSDQDLSLKDNYYRVQFVRTHIYCEGAEYDGAINKLLPFHDYKGFPCDTAAK